MKKILFLQNTLLHYRIPFYNTLSKYYNVTILHSGKSTESPRNLFNEILVPFINIWPFCFQSGVIKEINSGQYDAVIAMFDVRWIHNILAMFRFDRFIPWVWWGLDVGGSKLGLLIKLLIARRNNPIVFYNVQTLNRFTKMGLDKNKLFFGNNTFHVHNRICSTSHPIKNQFINVGSINIRKQNDITIRVFKKILQKTRLDLKYILIGEGPEKKSLQDLIEAEGLEDKVVLAGKINDPDQLRDYYLEAIASVSFGQAGLSVLQSMAFGVPFVTKRSAISGGEKYNIKHLVNGIITEDNPADLEKWLVRLVEDPTLAKSLGENAYLYYTEFCTIEKMVQGFKDAINYGFSRKI